MAKQPLAEIFGFKFDDHPATNENMDWGSEPHYPKPDFLSSSRKRLAPQLLYKGGILNAWSKKTAVALDLPFFQTLPELKETSKSKANLAFFVYDLVEQQNSSTYELTKVRTVYTEFNTALETLTCSDAGPMTNFVEVLQKKLDRKFDEENPPDAPSLDQFVGGQ